ncbi:MAG: hypothetical protein LBE46_00805, partial [Wolbachia pipientis]|nr:hypothetical protein [Wolbachia pipientis]
MIGIIAGKVLDIEGLTKELQDSKKEIEDLRNQVEMLSAETFADKQKGLNDQFYTLTGDISSEPDNAPRKKIKLSRSVSLDNESYVLLGSVNKISCEPNERPNKVQKSHKNFSSLIKPGKNPSEV